MEMYTTFRCEVNGNEFRILYWNNHKRYNPYGTKQTMINSSKFIMGDILLALFSFIDLFWKY